MSDIEYSVIMSDVIKSFDCICKFYHFFLSLKAVWTQIRLNKMSCIPTAFTASKNFLKLSTSADFLVQTVFFLQKIIFRNSILVSIYLDPDQEGHSVGSDLGPNCLQRLSADDKSCQLLYTT